ncbi:hypothetical protein, partial [Pseudomonas syringae]|uniref:hypothetical protein n=1 Tax=Pseudomonas syringae TaxID=317 RepID=UPI00217CF7EF
NQRLPKNSKSLEALLNTPYIRGHWVRARGRFLPLMPRGLNTSPMRTAYSGECKWGGKSMQLPS